MISLRQECDSRSPGARKCHISSSHPGLQAAESYTLPLKIQTGFCSAKKTKYNIIHFTASWGLRLLLPGMESRGRKMRHPFFPKPCAKMRHLFPRAQSRGAVQNETQDFQRTCRIGQGSEGFSQAPGKRLFSHPHFYPS